MLIKPFTKVQRTKQVVEGVISGISVTDNKDLMCPDFELQEVCVAHYLFPPKILSWTKSQAVLCVTACIFPKSDHVAAASLIIPAGRIRTHTLWPDMAKAHRPSFKILLNAQKAPKYQIHLNKNNV